MKGLKIGEKVTKYPIIQGRDGCWCIYAWVSWNC